MQGIGNQHKPPKSPTGGLLGSAKVKQSIKTINKNGV